MSINEIIAPVVEQLRSNVSSGVSKPTVRSGADVAQGNNSVKPSPSDKNGVTIKRVDEKPSREAVEKALDTRSSMAVIGDMNQFQQYQMGQAMMAAADNPSGDAVLHKVLDAWARHGNNRSGATLGFGNRAVAPV